MSPMRLGTRNYTNMYVLCTITSGKVLCIGRHFISSNYILQYKLQVFINHFVHAYLHNFFSIFKSVGPQILFLFQLIFQPTKVICQFISIDLTAQSYREGLGYENLTIHKGPDYEKPCHQLEVILPSQEYSFSLAAICSCDWLTKQLKSKLYFLLSFL